MGNIIDNINEGLSIDVYLQKFQDTVYTEEMVSINNTRVWISFDIDNDPENKTRKKLYAWFNQQKQIESWGNSVATFLISKVFTNKNELKIHLIKELQNAEVLQNIHWEKTKNVSLYIIYRSKNEKTYSGHFVLIQNAKVKQAGQFKC